MILNEGGNVWDDVDPFTKAEAPAILKRAQQLMPPGIELIPVGSAGHKASSGDMDIMVDADQVLKAFGVKDEKSARAALKTAMIDRGVDSVQTGINVHIKVPNGDKFAQVDIMLVKNAGSVSKFHQHDYSVEKTPFKGVHKHILLSSIAKETKTSNFPYGMMWSGFQGLFARSPDGKKADLITQDIDEVATILLGPGATGNDLGSVERILNRLPMGSKDPRAQHALSDPNWPKQDEPVNEELERIKKLSGLKDEDVSIGGLTKHDNGDLSYNAGPLSIRKKADGSSDSSYTMGDTTARVQQNPIGVKTLTAKGSAADDIVGVDASAARKGVDPTKFAAFRKQQAKEELDAMLRIARLR